MRLALLYLHCVSQCRATVLSGLTHEMEFRSTSGSLRMAKTRPCSD